MVAALGKCSTCGGDVPSDARTMGLCPRCLLGSAIGVGPPLQNRAARFVAPDARELSDELPNLEWLDLLGQGGMGTVYKARQRSLDRLVAVKLFPRELFDDPTFDRRFVNEARILASLSHPNVVAAYEFGETDRFCYLVMELIEGISLRQRMRQAGRLSLPETVWIARQVCDALAYAHSRGIVHRDIKPENILLEGTTPGSWRVRVADFGLAKLGQGGSNDWLLTAPNRLMGTPDYMAPEQRQSPAAVDHRADVYSMGVVLYEMLAGQLPIGRFGAPAADPRINRVVLRCLEPAPVHRYPDVTSLRQDLEALLAACPLESARWPMIAAYGGIAAFLMTGIVVTFIALRGPAPTRNKLALTPARPATQQVAANIPQAQSPQPLAPQIHRGPDTAIGIARPRAGFAEPPRDHMRFQPPAPIRTPQEFIDRATAQFGPNSAVTIYIRQVPDDQVDRVRDAIKSATGATHSYSSSSNGFVTLCLAPVHDIESVRQKINFGTITQIDNSNRTISVTFKP